MKKSLLALAVLGAFAGAASAQSSVTIYGVLDQAVSKGNGGTAVNTGANGTSKAWQLRQSTTSRLGFRGNEDLGGGLSAQFLIEHRFRPDTGEAATSSTNPFWEGGSYVQLTHAAAGSVYLGRWYTPAFWVSLKSDPFGWDGVGQMGSRSWAGFLTPGPTGAGVRSSNTVGYKTPNWGGFTANLATGLGEGSATVGRDDGLNVEFTSGPIYFGVGYEKINGGPLPAAGGNGDGSSLINAAFHWNFGVVKPMLYVARSKNGLNNNDSNTWLQFGLTAPIGPGTLKFAVARLSPEDNRDETKVGIGYDYYLSKRTNLYADFGQAKKDGAAAPGVGFTNNRAFALGVRHRF
ncbi:porin [Piscinibacter sp. HJYY11]|uniref:porin n=1 Tax=Piscinibacter sp. HJYY11 TaxID=2801333 RepID=UPI00191E7ABB|nr:porin [Piscinibacter sp. HJYY11]MBL0728097.1 porin [Piscinibacter sp. HJYY11]